MPQDIRNSVAIVAEAWKNSPYYADAEKWTFIFWEREHPFRECFDLLDLESVAELACGHGRHSEKIVERTSRLMLMDIHDENIDACRKRFASHSNVSFHIGNGYDFGPLEDASLTSIFCYDAMVHFSPDLVASYLRDSERVLKPGGMALFHHSNYTVEANNHYGQNPHARNIMSMDRFKCYANDAGLEVLQSKAIDWGGLTGLDGLTLVRRPAICVAE